ncbi:hypothetical protein BGX27_010428 [Mortierella sp. AM989]|nr:hypothetical protein BGX27_010428 [Mortierella sp. AM989]
MDELWMTNHSADRFILLFLQIMPRKMFRKPHCRLCAALASEAQQTRNTWYASNAQSTSLQQKSSLQTMDDEIKSHTMRSQIAEAAHNISNEG